MKKSLIAIAFAVVTTAAFAQTTPAQNPPASGATGTTGAKSSKPATTAKKTKKTPKKATPSTPAATTGGSAPVSK